MRGMTGSLVWNHFPESNTDSMPLSDLGGVWGPGLAADRSTARSLPDLNGCPDAKRLVGRSRPDEGSSPSAAMGTWHIINVWRNWSSRSYRSPTAVTAPNASPKASSPKRTHGTSCARTCWRRPRHTSSIDPGLSGFASTLSATKSSRWHEDSSRRFRQPPRRPLVPKVGVREGAPGRQPHHLGDRNAYAPPDRNSRSSPAQTWNVHFNPPCRRSTQGCSARRDNRGPVADLAVSSRFVGSKGARFPRRPFGATASWTTSGFVDRYGWID